MTTQLASKHKQDRNRHEQRLTPNGTLFEFLSTPDETGAEICLIRGTLPPGVAVPLHSHSDAELFYVLEGSVEAFQSTNGVQEWVSVLPGNTLSISGNIKHALRNSSSHPATMIVVTTPKLFRFFREVTKPVDPDQPPAPPTAAEIQKLIETATRYGYWMGSLEENAAIGLSAGAQEPQTALSGQKKHSVFVILNREVDRRALHQAAVLGLIESASGK